ncbi:MAG: class I SAM-dependent methyltransferase [Pseudomonadota bacterium]
MKDIAMTVIDHPATPMKPSAKFWDRHAKGYAKRPVANQAAYEEKLRVTRAYFDPTMEVLEFGCGTGSTALAHAPFVKHILATDISAKMLEIAEEKARSGAIENVTFQRVEFDDITAPADGFDAILGMSILHLLDERNPAIAKVYEMLKPGGIFVSSTACLGDTMKWFKIIAPVGRFFGLIPLVRIFTEQALIDSITGAGFRIEHQWRPEESVGVFILAKKPG